MLSLEELRAVRSKRSLTQEEKQTYIEYWQSSNQSQSSFCEQENLPLPTFNHWMKSLSRKAMIEETKEGFIAVEVNAVSKKVQNLSLHFKLPNGLVIEVCFSLRVSLRYKLSGVRQSKNGH